MIERLEINNIVIGKFPGSTTEINQPADQKPFKAAKCSLKNVNDSDVENEDDLKIIIEGIIKLHESNYNTNIDTNHRRYMIYGLLRIQAALENSIRISTLRDSFKDTGIFPFKIEKMISNCKEPISDEQILHWSHQLPAAKNFMYQVN